MACLDSAASITFRGIFGNFPLHSHPPKTFLEVVIHLIAAGVDRELGEVCLIEDLLSEVGVLGHDQPVLEP